MEVLLQLAVDNTKNDLLVESKNEREKHIHKLEVLERVGNLILLPDDLHVTVQMAAEYYEVHQDVIRQTIVRHKDELIADGLEVLKGERLSDMKSLCQIESRARSLTIIPRRALLRMGMLLRDSPVAKQIRTYLLNIEGKANDELKIEAYEQTVLNALGSQSDIFTKLITDLNKSFEQQLLAVRQEYYKHAEQLNGRINDLEDEIKTLSDSYRFKKFTNPKTQFKTLCAEWMGHFDEGGIRGYRKLYNMIGNWFGVQVPYSTKLKTETVESWILRNFEIDDLAMFINGMISGRIVKSLRGCMIDLQGVFGNNIEFERIKKEFNNECAYCGASDVVLIAEHLIAKSKPNTSDCVFNIVPACMKCNESKDDRKASAWYSEQDFCNEDRWSRIVDHYLNYKLGEI